MNWLFENIETYAPHRLGPVSVLVFGSEISKVGAVDRRALDALGIPYETIDGHGRILVPGLIDVHEHLLGASAEKGFGTQTPPIFFQEIVAAGITTVIGTLGVDSTTTNMPGLVAKVKSLVDQGLSAWCWVGGYSVPPATITGSVRNDILLISEIIGSGEIAISDHRCTDPDAHELARVVDDTHVAGLLTGKAGVTHFHVGKKTKRLSLLKQLLDEFAVEPESLYPTHVERSKEHLKEAIALVKRGVTVDMDVVHKDLAVWLPQYFESGADRSRLTISSDSFLTSPANLYRQLRHCIVEYGLQMEDVIPLVTANPARVLKLPRKGIIEPGADADLLILDSKTLDIRDVFAKGKLMVREGQLRTCLQMDFARANRRDMSAIMVR